MIPNHGVFLQQTIVTIFKDMWESLKQFIIRYQVRILSVIALIVVYFVVTRVLLRGKVYKTAQKEAVCLLTMSGRERSLEYLEKFGGMTGVEVQVVKFLRERGDVPKKYLEKTFGTKAVQKLIDNNMIEVR